MKDLANGALTVVVVISGAIGCGNNQPGTDEGTGISTLTTVGNTTGTEDGTTTQGADGSESDSKTSGTETDDGGPEAKFDTLEIPDAASNCVDENEFEYSYLWAANSNQGTISKIHTQTVTEVGRYIVRPDSVGSPSRTSVSLSGHVAVANRNGGVTKIYADQQWCQESNGLPGIQTSTNNQFLAWGEEECIAWYKPMNYISQRPVAWGLADFNQGTCEWENEELWTSGSNGAGSLEIYVLDGSDGATKEMVIVPFGGNGLSDDVNGTYYGIYGGAVDGNGDFWGSQLGDQAKLIRVRRSDMTWETWKPPGHSWWYGMTVDADGMVWMCSYDVGRFDPATENWAIAEVGGAAGCMADAAEDGLLWMADGQGVVGVNRDTLLVEKHWDSNGSYGISIDFEGYVWAVAFGSNANKVDPETGQVWTYGGLVGAYTYSDMTGYALSHVGTPSG